MKTYVPVLQITGLSIILLGGTMISGLFQPFSGSSNTNITCVGLLLLLWPFNICLGYWNSVTVITVNGNNFIVGIIAVFVGATLFLVGVVRHNS